MAKPGQKILLDVLRGNTSAKPPIWFMRQAGRHLPEYLDLRKRAANFLDFCYSPSLASEATLQPIRRYDMDGAILFADILLILDVLGRSVHFEPGTGPVIEKVQSADDIETVSPETAVQRLSPVYETVRRVRGELAPDKTLIGFCGAPWTVALYALEGRGKTDRAILYDWAWRRSDELDRLLDRLAETSALYLSQQIKAGADAVMIFESWAEGVPDDLFHRYITGPTQKIVSRLRALGHSAPIIGFPRGAGTLLPDFITGTGINAVGLGSEVSLTFVNEHLPGGFPVQGNLDPRLLVIGGPAMEQRVRETVKAFSGRPHIFNLGHGVTPQTPIAHVQRVVDIIREESA